MDFIPLVSVVIPVYNGSNYLAEAIESALSQTYTNIEVLVINDGSDDDGNTRDIALSYGDKIRYFEKENGGVSSALNLGIKEMRGDYFAWLSHDDMWLPDKIEKQIRFFQENPVYKICYTDVYQINAKGKIIKSIDMPWYPRKKAIRELFKKMYIHGCSVMVHKDCFDKVGPFSEELTYTQDADIWFRLSRFFEFARVPERLVLGRRHKEQGSKRFQTQHSIEVVSMYEKTFINFEIDELFPDCPRQMNSNKKLAKSYIWFGDIMSLYHRQHNIANKYFVLAVETDRSLQNTVRIHQIKNKIRSLFSYFVKFFVILSDHHYNS